MQKKTKLGVVAASILCCGCLLSGCGQHKNPDDTVGKIDTSVNAKHHDTGKIAKAKSDKQHDTDDVSSSSAAQHRDNHSDNNNSHADHHDAATDSHSDDHSHDKGKHDSGNSNSAHNGQKAIPVAEDNKEQMNTNPTSSPKEYVGTPSVPDNLKANDDRGTVTWSIDKNAHNDQQNATNPTLHFNGNKVTCDNQSISTDAFNNAKKHFQDKGVDQPYWYYFEWAHYAQKHHCSLDKAYQQLRLFN